jgi:hypothetical protein
VLVPVKEEEKKKEVKKDGFVLGSWLSCRCSVEKNIDNFIYYNFVN